MVELHYRNVNTGAIHRAIFTTSQEAHAQAAHDRGWEPSEHTGGNGHTPEQEPFLIADHDPAVAFDPDAYDAASFDVVDVVDRDVLALTG